MADPEKERERQRIAHREARADPVRGARIRVQLRASYRRRRLRSEVVAEDRARSVAARADPEKAPRIAAAIAAWARANPHKVYEKLRRYQLAHPEKVRFWDHNYRVRRREAPGSHTLEDELRILDEQGGVCAYCDSADDLTLDHKDPLSRGGSDDASNLQWLCRSHNSSKNDSTVDEYLARAA